MKVYINIIVMVNSFIANMNVITNAYRHFPIFIKTYVYIFLVSYSTHAHDNTQSYHQIWKAKKNHANLLARIFNSYGDFNIANGELHFFTQTCHSRPLRSGGSLTCYAYCNTCQPFILGNFEESSHSPMLPSD